MINMITLFLNYERFIVFCQESGVQVECITYAGKIVYGQSKSMSWSLIYTQQLVAKSNLRFLKFMWPSTVVADQSRD